jgi:hypothetical protein
VDAASYQGQAGDRPSPQVRERALTVVADVSLRSLEGIEGLSEQIGLRLLEAFPAFGQDADLEGEMHRAIHANLAHVFERVMPTGAPDALLAPPDALRFATSVLHRGIDTSDLIQAYRVGQNLAWSWWMQRLATHLIGESEVLIEALQIASGRMFAYVDAAIDQQIRLWDEERRRRLDHDLLALVREDPELIGDFMRRKLGGLAGDDPATERLRESVLVWLREGSNATVAATRLHTHKNTVRYRLQKAEEALGHPLNEDRLGLELALTLAVRFGLRPLRS